MVLLNLGDIIKIIAPQNDDIHDRTFYIDYIDHAKIKLIDIGSENLTKYELRLKDSGHFSDETIQQIQLLSRSPYEGFARQNGLLPNQWMEIHLGGDIPQIVIGEITNLEEDMIEIRTFPDREYIYIDFAYKGIPEEYPIIKFVLREKPSVDISAVAREEEEPADIVSVHPPSPTAAEAAAAVPEPPIEEEPPEIDVRETSKKLFFDIDEIVLGEELKTVTETVGVARGEERYGLETQINDMMDQLLAAIPIQKRTPALLSNIHTIIERYKSLRNSFSNFDKYGVITGLVKKGHEFKPFLEPVANIDVKLKWFLPVVTNKQKLFYDTKEMGGEDPAAAVSLEDQIFNIDLELRKLIDTEDAVYYKNSGQTITNKYTDLLQVDQPFFRSTEITESSQANSIITRAVNTNIETISSYGDDFYSIVFKNGNMARRRYVTQKYIVGETALEAEMTGTIGGGKALYKRKFVTPNDRIAIKSFLVLPEPVIRFSAINLPNTNILTRANLNEKYFSLWRLLKQKLYIEKKYVGGLEESAAAAAAEQEDGETPPFQTIVEYVLSGSRESSTPEENYIKLLNEIIPRTKTLFQTMKKYMTEEYTFLGVLNSLEPFMVYSDDISFKQYTNIRWFLRHKIADMKKTYDERRKKFNSIRSTFDNITLERVGTIYDLFLTAAKQDALYILIKLYDLCEGAQVANCHVQAGAKEENNMRALLKHNNLSSSEVLARVLEQDDGSLFMLTLSNLTATLTSHQDIMSFIDKFQIQDIGELEKFKPRDKKSCIAQKFAKKYTSLAQLRADDGNQDIFYDKEYDNTPYKVMEDSDIKKAKKEMPDAKFVEYLRAVLEEKHGFEGDEVNVLIETLLSGKKRVADGDFAVLVENISAGSDGYEFFRRQNSAWVKDTTIASGEITSNEELCRLRADCEPAAAATAECSSLNDLAKEALIRRKKQMMEAFNEQVKYSVQEVRDQITRNIEKCTKELKRRKLLREWRIRRADEVATALSRDLNKIFEKTTDSPYIPLRDYILATTDYAKKQTMILQFVQKYCDEYSESEPHWLICKETSTRLFPYSLYLIADAFINKHPDFLIEMGKIRAVYGVEVEDNVVDKNTGYILCAIDFSTEQGYDQDGFKISTYEVLEDMRTMEEKVIDAIDKQGKALTAASTKKQSHTGVFENEITDKIYNVAKTLARNLYLPFPIIEEVVLENAQSILERNLKYLYDKEGYEREFEKKMKKNPELKKITHETYKHQSLIWITAGMILIAVQTAVPSIEVKQTFPQCVMSFEGYPFDSASGSSTAALDYMACVINKTRSSVPPWDSIKSKKDKNEDSYREKIRGVLEKYILPDEKIKQLIKQKREYIENEENFRAAELAKFPKEHRIQKWGQFMPPLSPFHIGNISHITNEFKEELGRMIKNSNQHQRDQIGVIYGKMKQYTFAILESINRTVAAEEPLMKTASGVPFLENACCSGTPPTHDVLKYFANKDHDIVKYVKSTNELEKILDGINMKPSILFDNRPTGVKYAPIGRDFSNKELIYDAFIHYCRLGVDVPTPPELLTICPRKIEGFKRSWSIQEKILFLENNGVVLNREKLDLLMSLVGAKNRVVAETAVPAPAAPAAALLLNMADENTFPFLQEDNIKFSQYLQEAAAAPGSAQVSIALRTYIEKMTSHESQYVRQSMNMYKYIKKFTENNSISNKDSANLRSFLTNIEKWKTDELKNNHADLFYENAIIFMTKVIPAVFLNNESPSSAVNIPPHWNISYKHSNLLKNNIVNLNKINSFLSIVRTNVCRGVLQNISENFINIDLFIKNIADAKFDVDTRALIYKYIFFFIFCEYIRLIPKNINQTLRKQRAADAVNPLPDISVAEEITVKEFDVFMSGTAAREEEENFLGGNQEELNRMIFKILLEYVSVFSENKKKINQTFKEIYDGALKVKYREKEEMKKYFENMTQEQRDVEKVLMMHSLGKWNKGKQKSVHTYDKETFDEDLAVIERLTQTEAIDSGAASEALFEEGVGEDDFDDFVYGENGEKIGLQTIDYTGENEFRRDDGENMYRNNIEIEGDIYADGEEPDDNLDDDNYQILDMDYD